MSAAVTPLPGPSGARTIANLSRALIAGAFVIGILGGIALSPTIGRSPAGPVTQPAAGPPAAAVASAMDGYLAYRQVQSNLAAALAQNDSQQAAAFRRQLAALVDAGVISTGHGEHARLLASVAAAENRHDSHAAAEFRLQLARLCGPGDASVFEFCAGD
jgi:hypothetical protein